MSYHSMINDAFRKHGNLVGAIGFLGAGIFCATVGIPVFGHVAAMILISTCTLAGGLSAGFYVIDRKLAKARQAFAAAAGSALTPAPAPSPASAPAAPLPDLSKEFRDGTDKSLAVRTLRLKSSAPQNSAPPLLRRKA